MDKDNPGRKTLHVTSDGSGSALILGASSGFGEAAARAFAEAGYDIFGVHLDRRAGLQHVEEIKEAIEAEGRSTTFFNINAASPEKRAAVAKWDRYLQRIVAGGSADVVELRA